MKYDIVIMGGGPAGIVTAATARQNYPKKKILVISKTKEPVIPCGIPYMFTTLEKPEQNKMNFPYKEKKINMVCDEVVKVNRENKSVKTAGEKEFVYGKLVFATGSHPVCPPIKGCDKFGIYLIEKEFGHLKSLREDFEKAHDIVIVGGGFIGVELADEFSKSGKNVSIIERSPCVLFHSFDQEFSDMVTKNLEESKVKIISGKSAEEFIGGDRVEKVKLNGGKEISADLVVMCIGARSNSKLAEEAGLRVGERGGIMVDEYMRTNDPDIFAVGDCTEEKDFFTRKRSNVMLASTAVSEARIAGSSLYNLTLVRENKGTIASYSTVVGDTSLASSGMIEKTARDEGFDVVTGTAECVDRHPGKLPGAKKTRVKLVFSKCGVLLGGQIAGGESVGEMINIINVAIEKNMAINEIVTTQMATHPKLTAAPTVYPIITAALDAMRKVS